ncbi:hypothetical protein SAMN05444920_13116 [Nonomuraea solani]|uniref:Uncharacterized protein n=1 Tax=Nonomuraea solani TaxID=1144553 RepID=A0A1H6F1U9_9ACTN|nr:hypothetical protein [Nonomuraea solani]SEH02904.1 hypothetical protein SAMN05444920_13116 [Nonomuraea solani]
MIGRKKTAEAVLAIGLAAIQLMMIPPASAQARSGVAAVSDRAAAAALEPGWSKKSYLRIGYHDRCKGWHRIKTPHRSGNRITTSRQVHCGKGEWGRQAVVKTTLQQYRGLGYWRTKATSEVKKGRAAFTVTTTPSWKCSGGSQLYRNQTKIHLYSLLRGSKTATLFKRSEERRIRC